MEQALERYEALRKEREKELEKLKKRYNSVLKKSLGELLKRLEELERKELPKKMDERMKKVVEGERRSYVLSLRTVLSGIETMEDLGKRLPDVSKFHVSHGKYLVEIFDKDVYRINKLLKELSEEYGGYYQELSKKKLEEINPKGLIAEIEETQEKIKELESEKDDISRKINEKKKELESFRESSGLGEIEREQKEITKELKALEIDVRSKASKLQKPVKRMRLGGFADDFVRDSSIVIEREKEFFELLDMIESKLDKKQEKAAKWLRKNLPEKAKKIRELRKRLRDLEKKKEEVSSKTSVLRKEIWELEREIEKREAEIKRLRRKLEHLEKELDDEISKLNEILGERVER